MKISVMAGTPLDTKMGVEILKKNNYKNIYEISISSNPEEQTLFQTSEESYKNKVIRNYLEKMRKQNINILFVYCNSLSGSVDFEKLTKEYKINLITPLQVYEDIANEHSNLLILTANAQGLAAIEKVMFSKNRKINIVGLTLLNMVKDIENCIDVEEISKKYNFKLLKQFSNSLDIKNILLGCTHFPYIENELKKYSELNVINPTKKMLEKLEKYK